MGERRNEGRGKPGAARRRGTTGADIGDTQRALLDGLFEGCQVLDFEYRYLYLNPAAERHNRRPNAELLGRRIEDAWPGIEATDVYASARACLEHRSASSLEAEFLFSDGARAWLDLRFVPVPEGLLVLSTDITERKHGEQRVLHLNHVLMAIRDINHLLVREKNPAELARKTCERLVAAQTYRAAWVLLEPQDGAPACVLDAGWGDRAVPFRERVGAGWRPPCWAQAIAAPGGLFSPDPAHVCRDCPLGETRDVDPVVAPLRHEDVVFGMLGLCRASGTEVDAEESALLVEVADDLGLALYAIHNEKRRTAYEQIVAGSDDAMALIGRDYVFLDANPKYAQFWSATRETLVGRSVAEVTGEEYFEHVARLKLDAAFAGRTQVVQTSRDIPGMGLVHAEVRSAPSRARDGTIVAAAISVRDVSERRRAEVRERESEARLSVIFHRSPVGIVFTRLEDGLIVDANAAFLRIYDARAEDVIGKTSGALRLWVDPVEREAMVRALTTRGAYHSDAVPARRINGASRTMRVSVERVDLADGPYTLGVLEDVTDHTESQSRLRESEQRLSAIFHHSPFGILLSRVADRRVVDLNEAFVRLLGYGKEELLGRTPSESGLWADPEEQTRAGELFERGSAVRDLEMRARCRNGDVRHLRLAIERVEIGGDAYFLSVVEDISERRQVEEALRTRDRLLHEVGGVVRIGGWEYDIVTGRRNWTEGLAAIFDLEDVDLNVPPAMTELFTEGTAERFRAVMVDLIERARPFDLDLEIVSARGVHKHVRVVGRPVLEKGRVVKAWGALQDVTEQKLAEAERAALEGQLRSSQKLEAIGRLAGGVAHDFNNLLVVILNYADFALESLHAGDPLRRDIAEIRKAGERAATLTRQLLAFSRRQMLELAPLDLNRSIEGLEAMLRRILGEDIEFLLDLAPGLGLVLADAGQIEQVLMNLVVNARDAMPRGGTLRISTSRLEIGDASPNRYAYRQDGPHVEVCVSDTGCGMDEETRSRIFEPFFTTKEVGRGTGLGLATSYGIVKQSGGAIWVESAPGQGTTMRIHLPCTASGEPAVPAPAPREHTGGHETVLVVEDETALRDLVRRVLEAAGYHVLTAANGDEALDAASRRVGEIQLLLTDVVMPRIGGRQVAEALQHQAPALKVLYMSGYTHEAIVRHGLPDAGPHILAKPFTATELLRRVRAALDRDADPEGGVAHAGSPAT